MTSTLKFDDLMSRDPVEGNEPVLVIDEVNIHDGRVTACLEFSLEDFLDLHQSVPGSPLPPIAVIFLEQMSAIADEFDFGADAVPGDSVMVLKLNEDGTPEPEAHGVITSNDGDKFEVVTGSSVLPYDHNDYTLRYLSKEADAIGDEL